MLVHLEVLDENVENRVGEDRYLELKEMVMEVSITFTKVRSKNPIQGYLNTYHVLNNQVCIISFLEKGGQGNFLTDKTIFWMFRAGISHFLESKN